MNRFTLSPRRTTVGAFLAATVLSLVAGCGSSEPEYLRISLPGNVPLELAKTPGGLLFGKTEVTQAQFDALLGKDRDPSDVMGADLPVNNADAQSVEAFLDALNALPETKSAGLRFRLPTESEWREACLAGGTGPFGRLKNGKDGTAEEMANAGFTAEQNSVRDFFKKIGCGCPSVDLFTESEIGRRALAIGDEAFREYAERELGHPLPPFKGALIMSNGEWERFSPNWHPDAGAIAVLISQKIGDAPRPVAAKSPNAWGLYDMHGNVWELTSTKDEDGRVVACGGAWLSAHAEDCGAGARETFHVEPKTIDDANACKMSDAAPMRPEAMRCPELGFRVCAERVQ